MTAFQSKALNRTFDRIVFGSLDWLHLRDGTGSATDGTNDITVVTADAARVGDVVLVKGTLRTDRDLGMGYLFKVLVEDAALTK